MAASGAFLMAVDSPHSLSAPTAPIAPLRRCGRQQLATSASDVCCSASMSAAFVTLRPSGGTAEFSMIHVDGGRAGSGLGLRRLRPPPMVIVLRRLEVGATVRGREALPHGHSVADCPLFRPSRRLPQPARHDGIGLCRSYRFRSLRPRRRNPRGSVPPTDRSLSQWHRDRWIRRACVRKRPHHPAGEGSA
jgi:hypothetical protein